MRRFLLAESRFALPALILAGMLGIACLTANAQEGLYGDDQRGIWDGNGTEAKSGVEGELFDPGNTDGQSGVKSNPRNFWIPPVPQHEVVDPDELDDNAGKDYSPYALAQFGGKFSYQGTAIPKGYYHLKLGRVDAGSPKTHLPGQAPQKSIPDDLDKKQRKALEKQLKKEKKAGNYNSFVLKQLGKVIAVIPIERREAYEPPEGEKPPKRPMARIVYEEHRPVLKVVYGKSVYSTVLVR
jgi:hypothetical protein